MLTRHSTFITRQSADAGRSTVALTVIAAVVLAAIVGLVAWVLHSRRISAVAGATRADQEQRAYLAQISVSAAHMGVAQSYLGDSMYYLDAKVSNLGPRTVRRVDLQLEFLDPFNQLVLRDVAPAVAPPSAPLKPQETRAFRLTYEHISAQWNQAPPRITPVYVEF